jgi:hypothetical protein
MSVAVRVAVTAGAGFVVRRDDAVLFATSTSAWSSWGGALERFVDAAATVCAVDALLDEVVAAEFAVDPFVVVMWAERPLAIAFGSVELTSDLAAMPMLSGRGSSTWVERRLSVPDSGCRLCAGAPATGPSRLTAGIVPADGFELTFGPVEAESIAVPCVAPSVERAVTDSPPNPVGSAEAVHRADAWAALHDAAGGDWMDDSLGLTPVAGNAVHAVPASAEQSEVAADDQPVPGPEPVPPAAPRRGTGPPPTPVFDLELTLDPTVLPPPAHRATADPAGPAAVEPLPLPDRPVHASPTLGRLVLPDGVAVPIRGTVVLGRNPDGDAARVDGDSVFCRLDVGADVSRTHLVVRVRGTTIEAIDCGSSGHTVLLSPGSGDPLMLEAWVPYEVNVGDTLYLGGPTQVRIDE